MGFNSYHIVGTDVTQRSNFTFLLYGLPDGKLEATFEADTLGQPPIGAASTVATKYWARVESEVLAVFGAGWQAESQIEAVARILRRLRRVLVVECSPVRRNRFVVKMRQHTSLLIKAADS